MQAGLWRAQDAEELGEAAGPEPPATRTSARLTPRSSHTQTLLLLSAVMSAGFAFGIATGFLVNSTVFVSCVQ